LEGFAESKPQARDAEWVVQLPEEDIYAMVILLYIIHGQTHKVPAILYTDNDDLIQSGLRNYGDFPKEINLLFQITVATDKYQLTHLLKPWAAKWLDGMFLDQFWSMKLTWIGWVLGLESMVERQLDELMLGLFLEKPGQTMVAFEEEHGKVCLEALKSDATQTLSILNLNSMLSPVVALVLP
jgi:hypothetical protein